MPSPVAAVIDLLGSDATLAAIVGTRVVPYGQHRSGGFAAPYVTVEQVDGEDHLSTTAYLGLTFARLSISCVADNYPDADSIREAIKQAARGWIDESADVEASGTIDVRRVIARNIGDSEELPTGGENVPLPKLELDLDLHYRE